MARTTDNYNLNLVDETDAVENYRVKFNENMGIIDENMGGGGGGGDVMDVEVNGTSVLDPTDKIAKITSYEEVTLAEYEAIPVAERESNGIAYFIKDLNDESVQGYPPLIYSDEEREIGVWTDGKPLYQKTVSFTTGNTNAYLSYVTDIENPEFMSVDYSASFYETGTSIVDATSYFGTLANSDSNVFAVLCNKVNNKLRIDYRVGDSAYSKSAKVTVVYTKSTDTAGSGTWNGQGGIAHHYSENETVVGTWFGETLYEKSFDFGAISANSYKTIDVTALNIDYIPSFVCTALLNNGTIVPIPVSHTVNMSSQHFCRYNTSGTLGIYTGSGQAITQAYMTIQYTKTS